MHRVGSTRKGRRADGREADLDAFLSDYGSRPHGGALYLARHLPAAGRALAGALTLPVVHVGAPVDAEGHAVRRELARGLVLIRTPFHAVSAAIRVPAAPGLFDSGAEMGTLRRQTRAALRLGVTWERVADVEERTRLVKAADRYEQTAAPGDYRTAGADNLDIVHYDCWLLARAADGRPLLIAVAPVLGDVAALRYFRTLEQSPEASAARYLMTSVLVEELRRRDAQHLVDTAVSMYLPRGLRQFQRMAGFRLVRLRHDRPGRRSCG